MRNPARTLPRPEIMTAGPFRGMRDAPEPTTADPTLASAVLNLCLGAGAIGGGLTGRPGFSAMGARQGTGATRTVGGGITWTKPDATRQTVVVVNGELATYNWSNDTWTVVVTAANVATASCTLSATVSVALVPFADGLVVSDGVNVPFWWDGSSGAGGVTKMTNAPVFYGPPTVYYSKLVGIKNAARQTFVWSEEGDANLGYEAGGYNNAWDNPGGYPAPLTSVVGTNDALYVFRARVSLAITGAMAADFATAGTRANLSESIGTLSPWASIVVPQGVVIVDADAKPWLMTFGQPPRDLWGDCYQTLSGTPRSALGTAQSVVDDATRSLVIGLPEVNQTVPTQFLVFDIDSLQFIGVWSWADDIDRIFPVTDGNGLARIAHAGANDGYLYAHGTLDAGPWSDVAAGGATQYIPHSITASTLAYDVDREMVYDQAEAALTGGGITRVSVSYETSRGQSTPMVVDLTATTTGGEWDTMTWDTDSWAESGGEDQRLRMGLLGRGRWIRPRVTHSETGERFGIALMRVRAFDVSGNPKAP